MKHSFKTKSYLSLKQDSFALKNIPEQVKDHLVSGETFKLVYDPEKDILITRPQPDPENLSQYYESDDYISHTDSNRGLFERAYQIVKDYSLSKKTKLIKQRNGSVGTILDIGAGTGDFLKKAEQNNWKVHGVEPNIKARALARKKGITLKDSIAEFQNEKFDVVTLWHVLEHLPNLRHAIEQIENLVTDGGVLIIAVPNYKSYDAQTYNEYWAAYDVPRHLHHFSREAMAALFSKKFGLEKMKPMWFDSFYVSLLSEKYKSGRHFSLKALWIGFISNISALFTKECSSIIYCYRKIDK